MRWLGLIVLGAALLFPISAQGAGDCTVDPAAQIVTVEEQLLIQSINDYRVSISKLPPLIVSDTLNQAAAWQAADMAAHQYAGPVDSLGRTLATRLADCGVGTALSGEWESNNNSYFGDLAYSQNFLFDQSGYFVFNPAYTSVGVARGYNAFASQHFYWVLIGQAAPVTPVSATATRIPPTPTRTPIAATRTPTPIAVDPHAEERAFLLQLRDQIDARLTEIS